MNFINVSNGQLDQKIKDLVRKEREHLHELLIHLNEIDRRKLYFEMHYSSLFAYLTQELGYDGGRAQRRIDAARLIQEVPQVAQLIFEGKINLSQASIVQSAGRESRRLNRKISVRKKESLILQIKYKSIKESQILVAKALELPIQPNSRQRYQADESVRAEITFTKEQWAKVEEMRQVLAKSAKSSDLVDVIVYLAGRVIQKKRGSASSKTSVGMGLEKAGKSIQRARAASIAEANGEVGPIIINAVTSGVLIAKGDRSDSASNSSQSSNLNAILSSDLSQVQGQIQNSNLKLDPKLDPKARAPRKYISIHLRRAVFQKYKHCQYCDPKTGKVCSSPWSLEIEHRRPVWISGGDEIENLTLLCSAHNKLVYLQQQQALR